MTGLQESSTPQLDDQFLADVGLGDMPDEQRAAFLRHVRDSLEMQVGDALAKSLSDAQLEEFEALIDRDGERVACWLDEHAGDFLSDPLYLRMASQIGDRATQAEIICEYAASKWLDVNRPDYRDVVSATFETLRSEIREQAAAIRATF